MGLFSDYIPSFLNKAGEWVDRWGADVEAAKPFLGASLKDPETYNKTFQAVRTGVIPKPIKTFFDKMGEKDYQMKLEKAIADSLPVNRSQDPIVRMTEQTISAPTVKGTPKPLFKTPIGQEIGKAQMRDIALGAIGSIEEVGAKATKEVLKKAVPQVSKERGFLGSVKKYFATQPEVPTPPESLLKITGQYIPRDTDTLAIKARNLVQSNIDTAEALARSKTDDTAVATAAELIKHYGVKAQQATDKATANALYDRAADIANVTARNLTEQGRSIQAASILGRLTPEGQVKFAAREIQKYNELIETSKGGIFGLKKKIPELTGQQASDIITEMKAIEKMPEGMDKAVRFSNLQKKIQEMIPSPLLQKVISVWKAGLLTGLKTSGVNILSNTTHAALETAKDIPAVAVDSVASLFTKKRAVAFTENTNKGIREGLQKGWQYLKTGYSERELGSKIDYNKVNFGKGKIAKALQTYEESVFRLIGAEDQPFYYGAKARSIYGQALATAKNAKVSGKTKQDFIENLVKNPTDEMIKYAVLDAETAVFQNQTVLGKIAKSIQNAPGGEFVVPFGRTPSAVATQILNYSPVGIAKTIIQNIGKGKFDQRLFSQGIGRGLTGTAILAMGAALFDRGLIVLDRPKTETEQKLWELEGKKANSIKIGDKYRSVQILGPAGNLLLVGSHFKKAFNENGSPTGAMSQALAGSAKSFTEQTFLSGLNQVSAAINDPQRSAEGYLGNTLASSIPTIISDVARATDPLERRSENIPQKFQARIPGARQSLEPQVDVLGQEKKRIGSFLEVMADPTRPQTSTVTPLILELRRLYNQKYNVSPTLLGDKEGYIVLTPEQNTELWKRAGEITKSKLEALINYPDYWKLPDDKKAKKIDDFVSKSKLFARTEKILELTDGLQGQPLLDKLKELKESGLMTREVFNEYQRLR